jgi:hypothetical protein
LRWLPLLCCCIGFSAANASTKVCEAVRRCHPSVHVTMIQGTQHKQWEAAQPRPPACGREVTALEVSLFSYVGTFIPGPFAGLFCSAVAESSCRQSGTCDTIGRASPELGKTSTGFRVRWRGGIILGSGVAAGQPFAARLGWVFNLCRRVNSDCFLDRKSDSHAVERNVLEWPSEYPPSHRKATKCGETACFTRKE